MTKASNGKHDATIDKIVDRLSEGEYHQISRNLEYYNPGCQDVVGEIDAMAFKINPNKEYLLLFEVKSTDTSKNYKKAIQQLERSENHYQKYADRIFKFYVTPDKKGEPQYKMIR